MTRIRFEDLPSTNTPRNAENLNKLNNVVISPTEPTTGEEVWIDNINKKIYTKNDNEAYEEIYNDGSLLKPIYTNMSDTNFDNIKTHLGDKVQDGKIYMIANAPVSDNVYIQGGARHTIIGYEYANFQYGWQLSVGVNTIKFRILFGGVWSPWQTVHQTYLETEQCIGTWIDGKPLYRKVIVGSAISDGSGGSYNHNISNLDTTVRITAMARYGTAQYEMSSAGYTLTTSSSEINFSKMAQGISLTAYTPTFIIEYTKTTD